MSGLIKPGRRGSLYVALAALLACIAAALAPRALGHAGDLTRVSTLEHRLAGKGDPQEEFSLLEEIDGEPHLVREELADAQDGRKKRRKSLIYFGQITDFQLADEESPAREERFDGDPLEQFSTSGHRPHETLTPHQVELSIRQLDHFLRSPVKQGDGTRARLRNAVMTGDLADNMQFNETRWVLQLLEGGTLDPNTGTLRLEGTKCEGLDESQLDDPRKYTGVQDYDDYGNDNPAYYDPETPLGVYAERNWPTYPGLVDAAQKPFSARGLEVPSYVVFGNHDGLYQGTAAVAPGLVTPGATFEDTAVDCLKPVYPLTDTDSPFALITPDLLQTILTSDPEKVMQVPPDRRRRFVNQSEFKDIFRNGKQKDDHGFKFIDKDEKQDSNDAASYYAFSPERGVRYIVLDTLAQSGLVVSPTTEGGGTTGAEGNIDDPQWQWLVKELENAEQRDELVVAFAHHAVSSLSVEAPDEASPCIGDDEHGHDHNVSCDEDPRSSEPIHTGQDLKALFQEHPNVIAFVAGHSHENLVSPCGEDEANGCGDSPGFWEIKSPAIADWPPQHRLIEIMDNRDGTLSIFGTLLDHAANVGIPKSGTRVKDFGVVGLASIGRVLTFNDPEVGADPAERAVAEGQHNDRNVELVIDDPRQSGAGAEEESREGESGSGAEDLPDLGEQQPPVGGGISLPIP